MAINKVKLPNGNTENIQDSRIPGVDTTPTANSANLVTSGGVKSALGDYLTLTGGTLNSGSSSPTLTLNTSAADSAIKYQQGGSDKACIGYNAGAGVYLYNSIRSRYLSYKDDGSLLFENNKVWHAGNDGSGSGLDADLLDGWQGERYISYNGATLGNNVDFNEITYKRGNSIVIQPIHVNNYSGQTNVPFTGYGQMLTFGGQETLFPFRIAHSGTHSKLFYNSAGYKTTNEFNFSGGSGWKEIAFTNSNVASATYADGLRDYEHHEFATRRTSGNITYADTALHYYLATSSMTDAGRPGADGYIMHLGWDNGRWDSQLWIATADTAASSVGTHMKIRHHNNGADDSSWGDWHSVAMTDSNVASATKLETPRKIWGQSFDGTSDVSGSLEVFSTGSSWSEGIRIHPAANTWCAIVLCENSNSGSTGTSANTWSIHNNEGTFGMYKNGSSTSASQYISTVTNTWLVGGGNVGIGTLSPAYKLDVVGDIRASSLDTYLQTSQPSGGMLPNREYKLGTLSSATTFTLAAETSGVTNHYFWTFETGSTAPTITWPAAITSWAGGSAPSINSNRHYEVSVLNGVAVVLEV